MYDVFISYRRDGGFEMARLLYDHLKNRGMNVFLDFEELSSGHFDAKIYAAIENSKNFVAVLFPGVFQDRPKENDWLRLEIEHALQLQSKLNIIPVLFHGVNLENELPSSVADLQLHNGVDISEAYFEASMEKLCQRLNGVRLFSDHISHSAKDREQNMYFSFEDKKEVHRLAVQQNLMKEFDRVLYDKAINKFEELRILDIGSNNGDFVMDRIGSHPKVKKLLGVEWDANAVAYANQKHGEENRIRFVQGNLEAEDFQEKLLQEMENFDVASFNVVNISMVLLHLKSPYKLLKSLRKVIAPGGMILIKDIDDGLNLAYPDTDGSFARVMRICAENETSGYRYSGRQIPTLLRRCGFKNTVLEKVGIHTLQMSYEERAALFDIYFSFILEDLKIMSQRHPDSKRIYDDLKWYQSKYEELEEAFQDETLFFLLGVILLSAEK